MIRQALKRAFGVSLGVTIGGVLLPRLLWTWRYNATFPPLALHVLLYFVGSFVVCFLVTWLVLFLKSKF